MQDLLILVTGCFVAPGAACGFACWQCYRAGRNRAQAEHNATVAALLRIEHQPIHGRN